MTHCHLSFLVIRILDPAMDWKATNSQLVCSQWLAFFALYSPSLKRHSAARSIVGTKLWIFWREVNRQVRRFCFLPWHAKGRWADFGHWNCHHRGLDCPMQSCFHLTKSQQKHRLCYKYTAHSWAHLELWSCHHHSLDCPRSPWFHLPKSQQKHGQCHKSAEHFSADLALWSYHRHCLDGPMSRLFHLPESRQKPSLCYKSAEHSWADLWLRSCHHHIADLPMWQLYDLQHNTKQRHALLQLSLAAAQ